MHDIATDPQAKAVNDAPYSLVRNVSEFKEGELQDTNSPSGPCWSPAAAATTGPFMMAEQNEKIVRMSNALLGWKLGSLLFVCAVRGA